MRSLLAPNETFIQIRDGELIRVEAVGSLSIRFHQHRGDCGLCDFDVMMAKVFVEHNHLEFYLFSLCETAKKFEILVNFTHAHLINDNLHFMLGESSPTIRCMYATRMPHYPEERAFPLTARFSLPDVSLPQLNGTEIPSEVPSTSLDEYTLDFLLIEKSFPRMVFGEDLTNILSDTSFNNACEASSAWLYIPECISVKNAEG